LSASSAPTVENSCETEEALALLAISALSASNWESIAERLALEANALSTSRTLPSNSVTYVSLAFVASAASTV